MKKLDYFNSPQYLLEEAETAFYIKRIYFEIQIDQFKTKKSLKQKDKDLFQVKLNEFMSQNKLRTLTRDVCLKIDIYVHQENPPSIQNVPKVYIDLIEKVVTEKVKNRKYLLIKNDENIKILSVNYIRSKQFNNKIAFTLHPFSSIKKVLNVLYRFKHGYYVLNDDLWQEFKDKKENTIENTNDIDFVFNEFKEMLELEKNGNLSNRRLVWFLNCKKNLQEDYFSRISEEYYFPLDIFFNRISSIAYSSLKKEIKNRENLYQDSLLGKTLEWLKSIDPVSYNFQVKLPENPQQSGESKIIKDKMSEALQNIINRLPQLSPMFIPLSVLIVVLPGKKDVDVDNLARRLIIPTVEQHFRPPSDYYSKIDNDDLRYEMAKIREFEKGDFDPTLEKYFKNNSVRNYECIKLDRMSDDKEGFIHVCLHSNLIDRGFVERISYRLRDYEID